MSDLKKGQLCVIVGGCPENIGLVVEVLQFLGKHFERENAYLIRTVTGRKFNQLWHGDQLLTGYSTEAITDRHKLRPLVEPDDDHNERTNRELKEGQPAI